jgi:hypothetical protein
MWLRCAECQDLEENGALEPKMPTSASNFPVSLRHPVLTVGNTVVVHHVFNMADNCLVRRCLEFK